MGLENIVYAISVVTSAFLFPFSLASKKIRAYLLCCCCARRSRRVPLQMAS